MTIEYKAFSSDVRVESKAKDEEDSGIVEMIVSTYDTDSVGDRVTPGAFKNTLAEWKEKGALPPFIWSHKHDDPNAYIGDTLDMKETDEGLYVKAQIDMENPFAKRVYQLMRKGQVTQASFAYEVANGETVTEKDDDGNVIGTHYALNELKLFETGPTLIGANQNTTLLSAKSRAELMGKNEASVKCKHCDGTGYQVKDDEPAAKSEELDSDSMKIRVALLSEELDGE